VRKTQRLWHPGLFEGCFDQGDHTPLIRSRKCHMEARSNADCRRGVTNDGQAIGKACRVQSFTDAGLGGLSTGHAENGDPEPLRQFLKINQPQARQRDATEDHGLHGWLPSQRLDPFCKESGGVGAIDWKLTQGHAFDKVIAFHEDGDDADRPPLSLVEWRVIDAENVGTHGYEGHKEVEYPRRLDDSSTSDPQ
jgi:hypothetical protein